MNKKTRHYSAMIITRLDLMVFLTFSISQGRTFWMEDSPCETSCWSFPLLQATRFQHVGSRFKGGTVFTDRFSQGRKVAPQVWWILPKPLQPNKTSQFSSIFSVRTASFRDILKWKISVSVGKPLTILWQTWRCSHDYHGCRPVSRGWARSLVEEGQGVSWMQMVVMWKHTVLLLMVQKSGLTSWGW